MKSVDRLAAFGISVVLLSLIGAQEAQSHSGARKISYKPAAHRVRSHGFVLVPPPPAVPVNQDLLSRYRYDTPEPVHVIRDVELLSLIDDHVIIRFPSHVARKHGWPTTVSLNPGQHIGSLKLIATSTKQATFEEDGLRLVKPLAR